MKKATRILLNGIMVTIGTMAILKGVKGIGDAIFDKPEVKRTIIFTFGGHPFVSEVSEEEANS